MAAEGEKKRERKPLKGRMSCDMHNCAEGLHCFRKAQRKNLKKQPKGACQFCGAKGLINWELVRQRDPSKINETIAELKKEGVRHEYWCAIGINDINEKAIIHARKKGRINMREVAEKRILQSVGKAKNFWEGHQTPWEGERITFYAQHATATCCRRCMEYWHGIKPGRKLRKKEVDYLTSLLTRYIEEKLDLTEEGETVEEIRKISPELFPDERR